MRKKDLPLILVVVLVASVLSLVITNLLFVPKKNKLLDTQVVPQISSEFNKPDQRVFNKDAIDPTQLIQIGDNSNPNPL